MKTILSFWLLLILILSGCSPEMDKDVDFSMNDNQSDSTIDLGISDQKVLKGEVTKKTKSGITLKLTDDFKHMADIIRVQVEDEDMLTNIKNGQNLIIWYDYIRESYPPQTRGLKIELDESDTN